MRVYKSINDPIREGLSRDELLRDEDKGLILAWEVGRKNALNNIELRNQALKGELIPLGWKGGIKPISDKDGNEVPPQYRFKLGSFKYLAEYMGLRGEDLHLDTEIVYRRVCSRFGITVEYTTDLNLLSKDVQVGSSSLINTDLRL